MKRKGNKEAIALAIDFFKGNIALSLMAIGILIAIALLKLVPIVGIIFAFAYPILSFSIQVYVGKAVQETENGKNISEVASKTSLSDFFTKYIDIATGGFLGFFFIMMLFSILFFALLSTAVDMNAVVQSVQSGNQNIEALASSIQINPNRAMIIVIFISLVMLWMSYLLPGVMGKVIVSEDFVSAFKRSWYFFNPKFWIKTFNKNYFALVFIWSIIVFVSILVISWIAMSILLLPVALIALYCLSLYNAIVYLFAQESLN